MKRISNVSFIRYFRPLLFSNNNPSSISQIAYSGTTLVAGNVRFNNYGNLGVFLGFTRTGSESVQIDVTIKLEISPKRIRY